MTPRETALLTAAILEHEGHQLTPAEQRAIERDVISTMARQERYRTMMRSPAYQWKKPAPRR
ncbi:TPA: hypothetical protein RRJ33_000043 [Klebsiella pneumoniae]|nr:hypothetical protein [Klebsiella pneumoniae]